MSDTEKRVLLAIVISAVFMFAYPYVSDWISPPKKTETVKSVDKPGQAEQVTAAPAINPAKVIYENLKNIRVSDSVYQELERKK